MTASMLTVERKDDKWVATFGDFHEEEAVCLAESIDDLFKQVKIQQLELAAWSPEIEAVVHLLYSRGFVFMEGKDGHGEVVQRSVYKKRPAEVVF